MTRSGVNCDITDASPEGQARFIGSYAPENATFGRASNSGAFKPPVRMALSAPIIRNDDSAQGLKINAQQAILHKTKVDKKLLVVLYPFRSIATWVATAVPTG
jgi:hypothetical protein